GQFQIIEANAALEEAKELRLDSKLRELSEEAARLTDEINANKAHLEVTNKLKAFKNVDFSKLRTRTLAYEIGEIPVVKLEALNAKMRKLIDNYSVLTPPNAKDTIPVLVLYKRTDDVDLEHALAEVGFASLSVPPGMSRPSVTASELHKAIRTREVRMNELGDEIRGLADTSYAKVKSLLASLEVAADRSEITSRFSFSGRSFVLEGWVKAADFPELEKAVRSLGDTVHMEKVDPGHDEMPPTVLENPEPAGPFEFLTRSYSFPNYTEMDPSMIYMIFVPILYGMIVGDVVYGLISIVISKWLMKKFAKSYVMSNVAKLWFYSAFPTIVFGLIFDEWMGTSSLGLMQALGAWGVPMLFTAPLYQGFHRVHQLTTLIGITALVGLIQLGIGFLLGAINLWGHHRKHAYAKIAWLGVEIGGTVAVCALILGVLPAGLGIYAEVLLAVSIAGLFLTEGIAGVLEVPGLMGNVLSYARIAAIGIVGVILAEIINDFLMPNPSQGIFALLFFPMFVILHFANAFIAMFEALIQGGRLNLLEFRSKFLEGGGLPFKPFSLRSR
ncbi:MAG: V-type ATPase 116kDa subunit family protein, partial [Candidatus Micrarchaeota archaeon]